MKIKSKQVEIKKNKQDFFCFLPKQNSNPSFSFLQLPLSETKWHLSQQATTMVHGQCRDCLWDGTPWSGWNWWQRRRNFHCGRAAPGDVHLKNLHWTCTLQDDLFATTLWDLRWEILAFVWSDSSQPRGEFSYYYPATNLARPPQFMTLLGVKAPQYHLIDHS